MKEQKKQTKKTTKKETVKDTKLNKNGNRRGTTAASKKNLKPFKAGDEWNGNANGRTVGKPNWETEVKNAISFMNKKLRKDGVLKKGEEIDIQGQVLAQFFTKAMNGNQKMIELFLERFYGKVTQDVSIGGNGNPIENILIPADTAAEVDALRKKWGKQVKEVKTTKATSKKKVVVTKKIKFK